MQGASRDLRDYALVSVGANLPSKAGQPADAVRLAFERLTALSASPILYSSLWASAPIDCPPGSPPYINSVAALLPLPGETPRSLLHKLQAIENDFGRARSGLRNEARVLDLDLITFGDERCNDAELVLPHPRAAQRRFVLEPLREITGGEWLLPNQPDTLDVLLERIPEQSISKLLS